MLNKIDDKVLSYLKRADKIDDAMIEHTKVFAENEDNSFRMVGIAKMIQREELAAPKIAMKKETVVFEKRKTCICSCGIDGRAVCACPCHLDN